MRSRSQVRHMVAAGTMALTLAGVAGCHEPNDIVPVAPPGLERQRIPVGAQVEPQAIGEQGNMPAAKSAATPIASTGGGNSPPTPVNQPTKTASGLEYVTLKEGEGPVAKSGQNIVMHYTGTLADGSKFDSSRDRRKPFETRIGVSDVIKGWDEGVPGMKVGERRKLTIPPQLGYGAASQSKIPANSTLIFDVELLQIK